MALLFCDGFDHYPGAGALEKYTTTLGSAGSGTPGRLGVGRYLTIQKNSGNLRKDLGSNHATLIAGFAVRFEDLFLTFTSVIIRFYDGATEQLSIRRSETGVLSVSRNGTTLVTTSFLFASDIWYYVEFKATFHGTAGAYEVWVDNVLITSATGVDTNAT